MCRRSCRSSESRRRLFSAGQLVDVLLELVDLFVDVVEQVEEALGDVVDEVEGDLARRQLVLVGVADVAHALRAGTARGSPGVLRTVTIR